MVPRPWSSSCLGGSSSSLPAGPVEAAAGEGPASLPPEYFEALYRANADPWRYATSEYERAKYAATLAALPRRRYRAALEIGCSIGVFTALLAARCDRVLGIDVAEAALDHARRRCAHLPHIRLERRRVPEEFPSGRFDLVLLAEVGYYLSARDLRLTCRRIVAQLETGGHLLLVHWTGHAPEHPLSADEVHELIAGWALNGAFGHRTGRVEPGYRLDLFERR